MTEVKFYVGIGSDNGACRGRRLRRRTREQPQERVRTVAPAPSKPSVEEDDDDDDEHVSSPRDPNRALSTTAANPFLLVALSGTLRHVLQTSVDRRQLCLFTCFCRDIVNYVWLLICDECSLFGEALLLLAGDVEQNPGPMNLSEREQMANIENILLDMQSSQATVLARLAEIAAKQTEL